VSDQTVGNILRRHGLSPAPKRKQTVSWKDFIRSHRDVLVGMDFFTTEVLTLKGLLTYYVLFFIHLETRRVSLAGFTPYPDQEWMEQQARNMTMKESSRHPPFFWLFPSLEEMQTYAPTPNTLSRSLKAYAPCV